MPMDQHDQKFLDAWFDQINATLERIADTLDAIKTAVETPIHEAEQAGKMQAEREAEEDAKEAAERKSMTELREWIGSITRL